MSLTLPKPRWSRARAAAGRKHNRRRGRGPAISWEGLEALEPRLMLSATPAQIAAALDLPAGTAVTYSGNAQAVTTRALFTSGGLLGFPSGGDEDFLVMSTGIADWIDTVANDSGSQGTDLGTSGVAGDTATISFTLPVPASSDPQRFRFDFMFLSEEFPEFVGSQFNDFFTATVNGTNIAKDQFGNEVSINNVFFTGAPATGTFFDGRTALLTATFPVPDGVTSLDIVLSIGDVGDGIYDSAVILDNFRFETPQKVYLDFDGASIGAHFRVGTSMNIPAFSATDVGLPADQTADVIAQIVSGLEEKFALYDISFTTTMPTMGDFMTVVMGGSNDTVININQMQNPLLFTQFGASTPFQNVLGAGVTLFGQAQRVDLGNRFRTDLAVVFTGEFNDDPDPAINIKNLVVTTAHEAGHNLGLRHVTSPNTTDIMQRRGIGFPRSPDAIFNDDLMDLHEAWPDSAQQNDHQYLTSVLGSSDLAAALELGFDLFSFLTFLTADLGLSKPIYNVTVGIATGDDEEGAQIQHFDVLNGPFQVPFFVPETAMIFLYGSSTPDGPVDIYSGIPQNGNLNFEDTLLPLFNDQGELNTAIQIAKGPPGNIQPFTTLALFESDLGDVLLLPKKKGTFTDDDGDIYTVKLKGPGTLAVKQDDPDSNGQGPLTAIIVQDAQPNSQVIVTVKKGAAGDGIVTIGNVIADALKAVKAKFSDLVGIGINITGALKSVTIRDMLNGAGIVANGTAADKTKITARQIGDGSSINLGGGILKTLKAANIGDGAIAAATAGQIKVTGNAAAGLLGILAADITLSQAGKSLGKLAASHAIIGSTIRAAGSIGSVVTGILKDSTIFAGIDPAVTGLPDSAFDFDDQTAMINLLKVKGVADPAAIPGLTVEEQPFWVINSHAAAWTFKNVILGHAMTDNGGTPFGLAANSIRKATYTDPIAGKRTVNTLEQITDLLAQDDAEVRFF